MSAEIELGGGKAAILTEVRGIDEGVELVGRFLAVAVTPLHEFVMLGVAPVDRADELSANFDAIASSLSFFEPSEASLEWEDILPEE